MNAPQALVPVSFKNLAFTLETQIPKVLIVDLSENFGGASTRALALMQNYPPEKIALAALKDSPVAKYAREKNLTVITVGKKKYSISILFNLIRAVLTFGFEIIDAQNIQSKFWASLSALLTRTALVSTLNSWYANEHGKKNIKGKVYIVIELLTNWASPHYIVVSKLIYDNLINAGVKPDRISLIYNSVDIDITKNIQSRKDIRAELKIPMESVLCVALGRLVWAKGYENLIQAFNLIKEKNPLIHCLIIGDGEMYSLLSTQIAQNRLENYIFLYGYCDHLEALSILKACDIFVMPSRTEGTPIALLEAAAFEIPILATRVGGIPELVTEEDALLVPPDDPKTLANNLLCLAENAHLAKEMSRKAKQRVKELFTIDIQLEATLMAYKRVLQN